MFFCHGLISQLCNELKDSSQIPSSPGVFNDLSARFCFIIGADLQAAGRQHPKERLEWLLSD